MKKITLQVIADELKVSKALVSKALSNDPAVNEGTREKIWQTAEEMGYRIKPVRKKVGDAQTGNIVVLMPRAYLDDIEYWGKVMQGVEAELTNHQFSMILSTIDISLFPKEGLPSSIYDRKADGAIVMGHLPDNYIGMLRSIHFPFVMLDANLLDPSIDHILANNFLGAYQATNHLFAQGHRNIGFVGDPDASWSFRERSRGFREAIRDFNEKNTDDIQATFIAGIGVSGTGMYITGEFSEHLKTHTTSDQALTALFCGNDVVALETLSLLSKWDIRCPEDVSIIGFDDLTLTELMNPKLTTIRVPKNDIGMRAVQMLMRRIENPDVTPEHILMSTQLIERASITAPKQSKE